MRSVACSVASFLAAVGSLACHPQHAPQPAVAEPAAAPAHGAAVQTPPVAAHPVDWFRTGIIGRWKGVQSSDWEPTHPVELWFQADGTYHALCLEPGCTALFWGTDQDAPGKTWKIDRVDSDGSASGSLWLTHGADRSPEKGTLSRVSLSEDGSYLELDLWGPEAISTSCFGNAAKVSSGRLSFRLDRMHAH